ncbi:MAG: DUF47 family protein [Candidatus Altiarchaeales archaeon]|nr:DUF47 family protein [Candidatus Altiarchaeales archaeon]
MGQLEDDCFTSWLLRKPEREFFGYLLGFAEEILNQNELLAKQSGFFLDSDFNQAENIHGLITKSSRQLVKTRKMLIHGVSEPGINPEHRTSFLSIVHRLADIESHIESTSYKLMLKQTPLPDYVSGILLQMMGKTLETNRKLCELIGLFKTDLGGVLDEAHNISVLEDEIDVLRRSVLRNIVNDDLFTQPQLLFTVTGILDSLEEVSDKAESCSYMLESVASGYLP